MLVWADNFSRYGTGTNSTARLRDGPYLELGGSGAAQVVVDPDPNAASGSRVYKPYYTTNPFYFLRNRVAIPTPSVDKVGVLARVWLEDITSYGVTIFIFSTVNVATLLYVFVTPSGSIQLVTKNDGGDNIVLAETTGPVVTPQSYYHYEATYKSGTGDAELFLNGVSILTATGGRIGTTAQVHLGGGTGGGTGQAYYKDFAVWDSTGSTNNSAPMGTVTVGALRPDSDVTLGGWTPSSGATGYNLINETTPDDTTFLAASNTLPAKMKYNFTNLPTDVTSIKGLLTVARMRKVDGGDAKVEVDAISGAFADAGENRPITSAFKYWHDISELNPATGSPWTPTEVDAMTASIDRTM